MGYGMTTNIAKQELFNCDCMEYMKGVKDNYFDFTLTDIPYDVVNRTSNGLRNLDKENADVLLFDLDKFLNEVYRVTKGAICVFCSKEQFSTIYNFFAKQKGTTRPIIWEKSNPSPMNGQYIYLSGVEFAVWFKKRGYKTFNAFCKNTVFKYPNGKKEICPTQKNLSLFKELLLDNTNENDIVFDPCAGSFTTGIACKELNRNCIGCEIYKDYYNKAKNRINTLEMEE